MAGGVAGAAGSLVNDKGLVEGISITYIEAGETFNSAQVGLSCLFTPGTASVVSTDAQQTRIQPKTTCPVAVKE